MVYGLWFSVRPDFMALRRTRRVQPAAPARAACRTYIAWAVSRPAGQGQIPALFVFAFSEDMEDTRSPLVTITEVSGTRPLLAQRARRG
jgi:hypothetical protein